MGYDDLPNDGWGDDGRNAGQGCALAVLIGAGIWVAAYVIYRLVTA
jgi:hypothetical protein